MRVGSLCSGYGGLDLAVEELFGARTVWHAEYESAPSKILAAHWPNIPNHRDITTTDWTTVEPVEIMTAGYPCQPFSAAGKRKGTDDERHLWPYVCEAIRLLGPRFVCLENVAGHRSLGFDRVLGDLAEIGFHARWCSLRASDIGAPHHRERLFILAYPADTGSGPQWAQSVAESRGGDPAVAGPDREAATDANSVGLRQGAGQSGAGESEVSAVVGGHATLPNVVLPTPTATVRGDCPSERGRRTPGLMAVTQHFPTPTASDATGGGVADKYGPAIARWEQIVGPAPSPTEPNKNGRPRLNAAFSEWMMGLSTGWVTDVEGLTRGDQLKAIGNGVVPQQATAAFRWLLSMSVLEVAA